MWFNTNLAFGKDFQALETLDQLLHRLCPVVKYKLTEISDWSESQSDKEVVLFTVSGNSMKTSSGCNYKVL